MYLLYVLCSILIDLQGGTWLVLFLTLLGAGFESLPRLPLWRLHVLPMGFLLGSGCFSPHIQETGSGSKFHIPLAVGWRPGCPGLFPIFHHVVSGIYSGPPPPCIGQAGIRKWMDGLILLTPWDICTDQNLQTSHVSQTVSSKLPAAY